MPVMYHKPSTVRIYSPQDQSFSFFSLFTIFLLPLPSIFLFYPISLLFLVFLPIFIFSPFSFHFSLFHFSITNIVKSIFIKSSTLFLLYNQWLIFILHRQTFTYKVHTHIIHHHDRHHHHQQSCC